jgi:hypothetical protein
MTTMLQNRHVWSPGDGKLYSKPKESWNGPGAHEMANSIRNAMAEILA